MNNSGDYRIDETALELIRLWPQWEDEADQIESVEQDDAAGDFHMRRMVTEFLVKFYVSMT